MFMTHEIKLRCIILILNSVLLVTKPIPIISVYIHTETHTSLLLQLPGSVSPLYIPCTSSNNLIC
jgi:hypothetical protein